MCLYLEVTYQMSGKVPALKDKGGGMKLSLRKCSQADVGRREAAKTSEKAQAQS